MTTLEEEVETIVSRGTSKEDRITGALLGVTIGDTLQLPWSLSRPRPSESPRESTVISRVPDHLATRPVRELMTRI